MLADEWIVRTLLTMGGFGLGLVTAWANGALGEMGSHWAKERREHKRRRSEEQAAAQLTTKQDFMAGIARFNAGQERKQLERERVGRRFIRRHTPDDVGVIATVEELDTTEDRVILSFTVPPGRTPTKWDPSDFGRTSVEWAYLIMPAEQQRARLERIMRNKPDPRGWVEWEEIPQE